MISGSAQLERRTRQQYRLQQQLPRHTGGCGFASDDFDPGQCFAKGNTTVANPAIYDHGIVQGAVTPSMRRPCGSSPPCGR